MTNRRRNFLVQSVAAAGVLSVPNILLAQGSSDPKETSNSKQPASAKSPLVTLNNGVKMPVFGVGTYALPPVQAADVINFALSNGYRLIDTAANYGNEKEVGEGIARSGVSRSELFVTTKLWMEDYGPEQTHQAFNRSLNALGLEYLDLYLLHWPLPNEFEKTIEAYKVLEQLYEAGKIRAIGVCNFNPEHLKKLVENTKVKPVLNQIELHPYLTVAPTRKVNDEYGIKTESWSPIGGTFVNLPKDPTKPVRVLEDPIIVGLAQKYKKTPAQIVLRWQNQHGLIVMPKSQHYERLLKNIEIFHFELSNDDMRKIDFLNRDVRGGPDPVSFDVASFKAGVARRKAALE